MSLSPRSASGPTGRDDQRALRLWLTIALAGWAVVAVLGAQLYALNPPRAGFDLELLLTAGRRVADGLTPYEASMLAGQAPTAVDLFYSYPPPVAQYLSLFAGVPSSVMLVIWAFVAAAGLAVIATALAVLPDDDRPDRHAFIAAARSVALPVLALAPFLFPFAIALLFGNLDALFPLFYGLMLLGALAPTLAARFGGGVGLALAAVAKLHPSSMALWFLVRGARDGRRDPDARRVPGGFVVLGAAVAVGLAIVALSLVAGGTGLWFDYVNVLRAGSAADVVDPRNIGPAAQVAFWTGAGEPAARLLQIVVSVGAVAATCAVAWFRDDTLESFGVATVASLVVLPVTWFHYPVALIPVAVVAWLRCSPAARRQVAATLAAAAFVSVLAVAMPVLVWASVVLVLVAVRRSLPSVAAAGSFPTLEPSRISRFPLPGSRGAAR